MTDWFDREKPSFVIDDITRFITDKMIVSKVALKSASSLEERIIHIGDLVILNAAMSQCAVQANDPSINILEKTKKLLRIVEG